jgi:hypothetical protein
MKQEKVLLFGNSLRTARLYYAHLSPFCRTLQMFPANCCAAMLAALYPAGWYVCMSHDADLKRGMHSSGIAHIRLVHS